MKKILSMLTAAAVIAVPFGSFSAFAEEKKDCAASTVLEAALSEKLEKAEKFSPVFIIFGLLLFARSGIISASFYFYLLTNRF